MSGTPYRLATGGAAGLVLLSVPVAAPAVSPGGAASQVEAASRGDAMGQAAARKAVGGKLTMKLLYPKSRDVTVTGVIANGKVKTKRICADFREVRFRLLNPASGAARFTRSPAYGDRDKTYSGGFLPPRAAGVYRYKAVAPRARRAVGLKRAVCKKLTSPGRTVVVPAADPN